MAFNGPNKTLKEICLRSIAARPRLAFQISAQKAKKSGKKHNNNNNGGGGEDMSSLPWRRALAVYEATHERVRKMRTGRTDEEVEPLRKRTRRQRSAPPPTRENDIEESDIDRSILPNFLELVELKAARGPYEENWSHSRRLAAGQLVPRRASRKLHAQPKQGAVHARKDCPRSRRSLCGRPAQRGTRSDPLPTFTLLQLYPPVR
eukprot:INCI17229.4.p3 GENE.INCI17229.4~~INCI17229.4.p3  ORF type:complete len:205 (+),score=31.20 INCI17229.4:308-922(+)